MFDTRYTFVMAPVIDPPSRTPARKPMMARPEDIRSDRKLPRSAHPSPEGLGLEPADPVQRTLFDEQSGIPSE
jgi:hypothetical protein